jgi:hypothetical protein
LRPAGRGTQQAGCASKRPVFRRGRLV